MTKFFHNKTALITGASRGIGAAIATALAEENCNLILTCNHSTEELISFSRRLAEEYPIRCDAYAADASSPEAIESLFREIENSNSNNSIDFLINNAGISYVGLLQDMTIQEWQQVIGTNLNSVFYTSKYAIPIFLRKGAGRILNISSVWGNQGASMEVAYSASKGGLNSFTKALARELAPNHIPVNAISCGVIDTKMNACFSAEDMEALKNEIPASRIGRPEEVAALAVKILEAPDYMTGQIITIDGGWT